MLAEGNWNTLGQPICVEFPLVNDGIPNSCKAFSLEDTSKTHALSSFCSFEICPFYPIIQCSLFFYRLP